MRTIETERLFLRPHTLADVEAAYQMNLDKEVSKFTADGGVVSREEMERRIKEDVLGDYEKYGYGRFAVELKGGEKFIGFCGLKYLSDMEEVDLGYRLLRSHWGKGLATEASRACLDFAFNDLKLESVVAMLLPENIASVRVLDKLGFSFEKEFEEYGEQVALYRLKKGEWLSKSSKNI